VLRRARQDFRRNRGLAGASAAAAMGAGQESLAVLQRQSAIAGMYHVDKSVMESPAVASKRPVAAALARVPPLA